MPLLYNRLRRSHAQSASPWAVRPAPCEGEVRTPDEITVGMLLELAHRRYKIAEGFKPKTVRVTRGPYGGENGRLTIDIEYLEPSDGLGRETSLMLSSYGVVEYDV